MRFISYLPSLTMSTIFALIVALLLCFCAALAIALVRTRRKVHAVINRLGELDGLLRPDKAHQRNPEMRLVFGRRYLAALTAWAAGGAFGPTRKFQGQLA
jgi:hypothetical protein